MFRLDERDAQLRKHPKKDYRTTTMNSPASDSMYALQDVPGKGKGLVATQHIPKGTRILSEQPLITIPRHMELQEQRRLICQKVEALRDDQRRAFLSLHNAHPSEDSDDSVLFCIFQTNALPGAESPDNVAVFLEASRINHDCENNAVHNWNDNIQRHTVHAMTDIHAGEEITISYVLSTQIRIFRQTRLELAYKFRCACRLCSLPVRQSRERDHKLEQIARLDQLYETNFGMLPPERLGCLHTIIRHWVELGRENHVFAKVHEDAAILNIVFGDLARGRYFAQKAASIWSTLLGTDDKQTAQCAALARNPSGSQHYRGSKLWKTALSEFPQGLGLEDFENWLWKREEIPKGLGQPRRPTTQSSFSGYVDIPHKNGSSKVDSSKQLHWCLLGEITQSRFLRHLSIATEDIYGDNVPVHFYTKGRGKELMPSQYQRGYTVAILDECKYAFEDRDNGIRLEDPQMIKIFPLSLTKMLDLNDLVRKFSIRQQNGMRTCHGCGTNAAASSMKRCGKCLSFWYCTKMAGWTTKAHKADCKFLRDPDLRGLFLIKWDEVQDCISFPLKVADDSM
ncbi:hypothetical protein E4U45_004313 [Claviceps purpurea]|nr:hypothetical protein E4U45_004313 [Claviceps purpurea]